MTMPDGSYPMPTPRVRFDVINQAWAMLQQQMGTWVLVMVAYVVVAGLCQYILGKLPYAGALLSSIPSAILMAGVYKVALKHIRGEVIAVGDMFSIGDVIGPVIVASILTTIGTAIGLVFCVIPGVVLSALWLFTLLLIVDRGLDGVAAMRESLNALKGEWLMITIFMIVVALVGVAGVIACGVGVLITAPIAVLSIALLYRDFFPETGAGAPGDPYSAPPL
ncbi:MAG: hypothetical protein GX446_03730 [Chthonomonadales bacterium]|nr:hypothetical protein [Chthonomonadales bacterium]